MTPVSRTDAAARLRYAVAVRTRARRAVLLPSFSILIGLGAIVATHGVVAGLWPGSRAASLVWLAGVLLARPLLKPSTGGARRLPLLCAVAAVAAAGLAALAGVNPLVTGLAVLLALRAQLAGLPLVAVASLAVGAAADAVLLQSPRGGVEVVLGAALIAGGLAGRAFE